MRQSLLTLAALCFSSTALHVADVQAQAAYPSRPITLVAPYAAGGPVDQELRVYLPKLNEFLGQPTVVEFKPGAASTIGMAFVAKAPADGYTLLAVGGSLTSNPALYKDLPFDSVKDFAPISLVSQQAIVFVAYPGFPIKGFTDYIAYAKANPGKINFGTGGSGGIQHLVGAWVHSVTNTQVTFVANKGSAPLILELMAGRLDVIPTTIIGVLPHIKAGKLKAFAITDDKRSKLRPDVPTIQEQGLAGFRYTNWTGIVAPGATPPAIINRLGTEYAKVTKLPDVAAALESQGNIPVGNTPAQFRQLIVSEMALWQKVVKDNNIKLDE